MLTTYIELVEYFQDIPTSIPAIKGVTVGIDEDIANSQNTAIRYPHLWVETPTARFTGTDDDPATLYNLAVVILHNEPTQNPSAGNQVLSDTMSLMELLYAQLLTDADSGTFDLILDDNNQDPIRRWSADNAYGWRMEVKISLPREIC